MPTTLLRLLPIVFTFTILPPTNFSVNCAACREYGCETVLELGPGHALATMAREAIPGARVHALEEFRSASGAADWVAGR